LKVYRKIEDFKQVKHPIVTVGTFDGVHIGHQKILNRIREIASKHNGETVLLTFFPHPRMILHPDNHGLKLINTLDEKIELLEKFGLDHLIILPFDKTFSQIEPEEYVKDFLVNKIKLDTIVIGYDHHFGKNRAGDINLLKKLAPKYNYNVEEITAQEIEEIAVSSTKIRKAILEGDITTATEYLNHPFSIRGIVIKGKQIGRSIGFPTANIDVQYNYKIIPKNGVYAVNGTIDGKQYNGMLNIGNNPTIESNLKQSIEVHFFGLNANLYGKEITINFVKRLRDEQRFDSLTLLKQQLQLDKAQAEQILAV